MSASRMRHVRPLAAPDLVQNGWLRQRICRLTCSAQCSRQVLIRHSNPCRCYVNTTTCPDSVSCVEGIAPWAPCAAVGAWRSLATCHLGFGSHPGSQLSVHAIIRIMSDHWPCSSMQMQALSVNGKGHESFPGILSAGEMGRSQVCGHGLGFIGKVEAWKKPNITMAGAGRFSAAHCLNHRHVASQGTRRHCPRSATSTAP